MANQTIKTKWPEMPEHINECKKRAAAALKQWYYGFQFATNIIGWLINYNVQYL